MAAKAPAITIIVNCLLLIRSTAACLLAPTPSAGSFRHETHPAFFASTNCHWRRKQQWQQQSANHLQMASDGNMNQNAMAQPADKRMRITSGAATSSENGAKPAKGTLYITVGPQCAGKTTLLKQIFGRSFRKNEEVPSTLTKEEASSGGGGVDITIDDQALVYVPVPTGYFLDLGNATSASFPSLDEMVFGKTVRERIIDPCNDELALVTQRLGGMLGARDFRSRLTGDDGAGAARTDARTAKDDLVEAVEEAMQAGAEDDDDQAAPALPEKVDLFVVESIFRPRPLSILEKISHFPPPFQNVSESETMSALDFAQRLIKLHANDPRAHAESAPLSWGNTNTRPREFETALDAAAASGRPVEFVIFGGREACEMIKESASRREFRKMDRVKEGESDAALASEIDDGTAGEDNGQDDPRVDDEKLLCLPKVDRKALLSRNLRRFLQCGRYIPSNAIVDAMVRVESMLASATAAANREHPQDDAEIQDGAKMDMTSAKFQLDFGLAKMAGYRMNADRTVVAARQFSNHAGGNNRNHGSRNKNHYQGRGERRGDNRYQRDNNHQRGRGDSRHRHDDYQPRGGGGDDSYRQQSDGYYGGRRHDYGGRGRVYGGGRSRQWDSRSNDRWDQRGQDGYNRYEGGDNHRRSHGSNQREYDGRYRDNQYRPSRGRGRGQGWGDRREG